MLSWYVRLKTIFGAALLLFGMVSLLVAGLDVVKDIRKMGDIVPIEATPCSASSERGNRLFVYVLHGNAYCPTCEEIKRLTLQVVTGDYASRLGKGELLFRDVNVEERDNECFIETFQIFTTSLVLARYDASGDLAEWKNLSAVWDLASDPAAFRAYLQDELDSMLQRGNGS
jgi:hypothetical protein